MNLKNVIGVLLLLSLHSKFAFGELRKVSEIMAGIRPQTITLILGEKLYTFEVFRVYNAGQNIFEQEFEGGFVGLNVTLDATQSIDERLILNGNNIASNALVVGNVVLGGNAKIFDNAIVGDNARVFGDAQIADNAIVGGNARVFGDAQITDSAMVGGNAKIFGNAKIYEKAKVYGDAIICDLTWISGRAKIFGDAHLYGETWIDKNEVISDKIVSKTKINNFYENLILETPKIEDQEPDLSSLIDFHE